jgi:hypothetical protein
MDEFSGAKMFGQTDEQPMAARQENAESRPKPEQAQKLPLATELLVWIRQRWNKPTISLRDIMIFAPRAVRDRETATKHAEILEKHGWLAPMPVHRRDRRVWRTPPAGATALPED